MLHQRIPAKRGAGFQVNEGDTFEVIDPLGGQVADLVAFDADDVTERFSTKYTVGQSGKVRITTGDELLTTEGEPILTITADDCGVHDLLYAPCNHWVLRREFGIEDGHGCRENLSQALDGFGVPADLLQDPLNVFMKSTVTEQTYVDVREPVSEPGDAVEFRAETDAYVGVSACACEGPTNAGTADPIDLRVPDGTDIRTNV